MHHTPLQLALLNTAMLDKTAVMIVVNRASEASPLQHWSGGLCFPVGHGGWYGPGGSRLCLRHWQLGSWHPRSPLKRSWSRLRSTRPRGDRLSTSGGTVSVVRGPHCLVAPRRYMSCCTCCTNLKLTKRIMVS